MRRIGIICYIYDSSIRRIFWPTANHYNETLQGSVLKGCKHAKHLNFGEKPQNFHVYLSSIRDVCSKQRSIFEFLYRDTDSMQRRSDIYIYMISFRGKGSRKAVLSSNLRTLDTQNKVRLISQPPQEIFFLLDLGDILLRGYDCLSIETRFYIPLLFVQTKSVTPFFFLL